MSSDDLDNPVWNSLLSTHASQALRAGDVARYPPDVAPFLAVSSPHAEVAKGISTLVGADETVYLLGVEPALDAGWSLKAYPALAQMECTAPIASLEGPRAIELDASHRADVLELTALVYPHYFRLRTMELGRYFGLYENGRLAAMIGERMGTGSTREISAVCTHPDFTGRGHARRLLAMLTNDLLHAGLRPFLHVSHENQRALRLYLQMGYGLRRDIGFWSLKRR